MRKCLLLMFCAALLMPRSVPAIAASQAWVANYVSNFVAQTASEVRAGTTTVQSNGYTVITAAAGTDYEAFIVVQNATDAALVATNCTAAATSAGITNGLYFVWNGDHDYINPAGTVTATPSNFVYSGTASVYTNGFDRFAGLFDVVGVLIQPDTSYTITNSMEVTR